MSSPVLAFVGSPTFGIFAPYPNPLSVETRVDVGIPDGASVRVSAETLAGETADVIAPETERSTGWYSLRWDVPADLPGGIYNVSLTAAYRNLAHNDSTRTVVVMRDNPVVQPLGRTGSDGTVTLADPVLFDQLRWKGTIPARNQNRSAIGTITASRRVLIRVRDPDTEQTETYERDLLESTDEIDLTWTASASSATR